MLIIIIIYVIVTILELIYFKYYSKSWRTTLLDGEIFRPDQVWFTEKDNSMTKLYSLLDFRPRENESLQKGYLLGRYGAIPFINGLNI